jgi:ABC-type multidrug transport system fused ATPase/permease subunit
MLPSLVTFALILFLKPLNFATMELQERFIFASIISVVVAFSIFIGVKILSVLVPKYVDEDQWTIGKEISLFVFVLLIITISITLVIFVIIISKNEAVLTINKVFRVFLNTTYITFGISIVPVFVIILFEQYNHQKKQFRKAEQISSSLQKKLENLKTEVIQRNKLVFSSDNKDIELQIDASNVIFIQSEGNYVEVFYIKDNLLKKKTIRQRLKAIEDKMPKEYFFRCHNRYIVNTKRITNVNGNARGLYIEVENSKTIIPVSRSKVKQFKEIFENI